MKKRIYFLIGAMVLFLLVSGSLYYFKEPSSDREKIGGTNGREVIVKFFLKGEGEEAIFKPGEIELKKRKNYIVKIQGKIATKSIDGNYKEVPIAKILKLRMSGKEYCLREKYLTGIKASSEKRKISFSACYLRDIVDANFLFIDDEFVTINENNEVDFVLLKFKEVDTLPIEAKNPRYVMENVIIPDKYLVESNGTKKIPQSLRQKMDEYWENDPNGKRIRKGVEKADKKVKEFGEGVIDSLGSLPEKMDNWYDRWFNRKIDD